MRAVAEFGDERLELDLPDGRLVAARGGPPGLDPGVAAERLREALERPVDYPPLRQVVVPGDRVVLPFAPDLPAPGLVLSTVVDLLVEAGVAREDVTLLAAGEGPIPADIGGIAPVRHDPDDRAGMAYLASTSQGRRIYLDRLLTDADAVVPVGLLGYDPILGYRGPWSVLFPGASDRASRDALRADAYDEPPDRERPRPALAEAGEVSWLLGSQFHLGIVPGVDGILAAIAGEESGVRARGMEATDAAWSFRPDRRADLVVAGVGRPGAPATLDDLAAGLATAEALVRRGGKIALLSRAGGEVGPAFRRLIDAGEPRAGLAALRGHPADPDHLAARRVARAAERADVYVLSSLSAELIEDLGMVALSKPEEARRLADLAGEVIVISQADRTRAVAPED